MKVFNELTSAGIFYFEGKELPGVLTKKITNLNRKQNTYNLISIQTHHKNILT